MGMNTRAQQTAGIIGAIAFLGSLFVVLRLYTRFVLIRAPGWEDWVLICSWLCAIATVTAIGIQTHYGMGGHGATLSAHENEMIGMYTYISIITYCASIGLTKLAILMQYQRVFHTRTFQIWTWSFIAIIVGFTVATVVSAIFLCTPAERFWRGPAVPGTCINTIASWFSNASINIVTDLMIIVLPMPVVKSLKLPPKQKWLLMGVFAFGAVVCVISIIRLHSLLVLTHSLDPSYDNAPAAILSIAETYVALICACLPTLRPLLALWFTSLHSSTSSSSRAYHTGASSSAPRKRSSVLPSFASHHGAVQLSSLGSKRGIERLDGDEERGAGGDRIKVVTRVDVRVSEAVASPGSAKDGRESSTETLFRDAKHIV